MRLKDRTVALNSLVRLTCRVEGSTPLAVRWFKDSKEIRSLGKRVTSSNEGSFYTLEIGETNENDSAEYSVTAENDLGGVACRCKLIVNDEYSRGSSRPPSFLEQLEDIRVTVTSGSVSLRCRVNHPGRRVNWCKDGVRLPLSRKHRMRVQPDGTCILTVADVTSGDAGSYSCVASNEFGKTSTQCRLTVDADQSNHQTDQSSGSATGYSRAPVFLTKPRSTDVIEGDTVELLCDVIGDPKPEVLWLRDGLKFEYQKDPAHFLRLGDGPRHRLEIPSVTIYDTGAYAVVARNDFGETKAIISLQVYARGQGGIEDSMSYKNQTKAGRVATRPEVAQALRDLRCADGDSVTFECRVRAVPEPEVRWEKDGHLVQLGDGTDFVAVRQPADEAGVCRITLTVSEVYPEDAGTYACVVYNDAGRTVTSARLVVECSDGNDNDYDDDTGAPHAKPIRKRWTAEPTPSSAARGKKRPTPPKFSTRPHSRVVDEGETVKFSCSLGGWPAPTVRWDKQGRPIAGSSGRTVVSERDDLHWLLISDVTPADAGTYTVTAVNGAGRVTASVQLDVIAKKKGNARSALQTPSSGPGWSPATSGSSRPGPDHRSLTVTAFDVPRVLQPLPGDMRLAAGAALSLRCQVTGRPRPEVAWLLDAQPLERRNDCRLRYNGRLAVLELAHFRPEPTGRGGAGPHVVTCVATNCLGESRTSTRVTITGARSRSSSRHTSSRSASRMTPATTRSRTSSLESDGGRCAPRVAAAAALPANGSPFAANERRRSPSTTTRDTDGEDETMPAANGASSAASDDRHFADSATVAVCEEIVSHTWNSDAQPEVRCTGCPPKFLRPLVDVVATTGSCVTLEITVEGEPPFEVVWTRDDMELHESDTVRHLRHGCPSSSPGTFGLVLERAFPEDSGCYACEVYNRRGNVDTSCRIRIEDSVVVAEAPSAGPQILTTFQDRLDILEGDPLELVADVTDPADVTGRPPHVEWFRDRRKLVPGIRVQTRQQGARHVCSLSRVRMRDAGIISVVATDASGLRSSTVSAVLDVRPRLLRSRQVSLVATPIDLLVDQSALEVDDHRLPVAQFSIEQQVTSSVVNGLDAESAHPTEPICQRRVDPDSPKDSKKKATSPAAERRPSFIQNSFPKHNKNTQDCEDVSSSPKQMAVKLSLSLTKGTPAQVIRGPQNASVLVGQKATLKVHFIGKPPPAVKWIKGGNMVECCSRVRVTTCDEMSCLTLDDVHSDDSGKYIVIVENTHGADCHFASLAVEGPPDPPASSPVVSDATSSTATLCWYGTSYDGGSCVTGYIVEMCRAGEELESMGGAGGRWQMLASNCHSTSYVARGLAPGHSYVFRVRAQNVHGVSSPSRQSEAVEIVERPALEDDDDEDAFEDGQQAPTKIAIEDGLHFDDLFDVQEELGKGRFGHVHRVVERRTGLELAAKLIRCIKSRDKDKVREEVDIMNEVQQHPRLLQLIAAFERPKQMIIIVELISGGELFERVVAEDFDLTERDCILFTRHICEGVRYIHERKVIHLDLKPENILCVHRRQGHAVKLIDFGLARRYSPDHPTRVMFGTAEFVAPEVVGYEPVSPASDMWSVGVICYVLLSGLSPFMGENDALTFSNITRSAFDFDDEAFDAISNLAKDFISALLVKKPESRLPAAKCLRHQWLSQHERSMSSVKLSTDKLKNFVIRRKWQRTAVPEVAAAPEAASAATPEAPRYGKATSRLPSSCWQTRPELPTPWRCDATMPLTTVC